MLKNMCRTLYFWVFVPCRYFESGVASEHHGFPRNFSKFCNDLAMKSLIFETSRTKICLFKSINQWKFLLNVSVSDNPMTTLRESLVGIR